MPVISYKVSYKQKFACVFVWTVKQYLKADLTDKEKAYFHQLVGCATSLKIPFSSDSKNHIEHGQQALNDPLGKKFAVYFMTRSGFSGAR